MSPDRKPSDRSPENGPERRIHDDFPNQSLGSFLREQFEKTQPDLEAKASESMPRDLDDLFEKQAALDGETPIGNIAGLLTDLFSHDLQHDSQLGSPARQNPAQLDAATASELDRRVAQGIRQRKPQPVPIVREPQLLRAPQWTGLAAAGLIGMLYLWGQGYLSTNPDGQRPLFVLVDVEKPLDTSMDPGAISLAAAGAIDFVEGRSVDVPAGDTKLPKKRGEE